MVIANPARTVPPPEEPTARELPGQLTDDEEGRIEEPVVIDILQHEIDNNLLSHPDRATVGS
jgi:hypothetical protein